MSADGRLDRRFAEAMAALPHAPDDGATLVVAVSGGADSMALWDLLVAVGRWRLVLWHLDHGLRPEAGEDLQLIRAQAQRLRAAGLDPGDLVAERADVAELARRWHESLETAGRRQRYARLALLARERGAVAVLTAHHRDDQAETVLANLLRGAGPVGTAGMPPRRLLAGGMPLLRPLLGFSRADLRGHCAAASVPWLEDRSNADLRHRRNYLRRVVLPGLEQGVPGLTAELVALAGRSRGEAQDLDSAALAAWGHALGSDGLRLAEILAEPLALRRQLWRRLLLHLGVELERSRLMRVDDLAHGAVGRRLHLGPWLLLRRRHTIAWERAQPQLSAEEVAIPAPGDYRRGDAWLSCRRIPRPSGAMAAGNQAWLDADRCGWPLSWRPATGQDRFTPLGAPGRQTVAKFLSSRGVPSRLRHGAAVVADREGVVWVPGLSIADRVRVGPSTTTVLHLEWEPSCGTDRAPTVPNRQDHTDASR